MSEYITAYVHVAWLNEKKNIEIVQNGNRLYVRKQLQVYEENIYGILKKHSVKGVPKIYDFYHEDNKLILIEEYISGKTLEELLDSEGVMDASRVADIALQLCDILTELMKMGIVHRDIKPSNVIQCEDGRIFLIDMNAAKILKESEARDTKLLGTEGFAAPEQFGFGSSNEQTDIYGLGILMTVLLTGDIVVEKMPANELSYIIRKCTRLDRKGRYKNAAQVKKALKQLKFNKQYKVMIVAIAVIFLAAISTVKYSASRDEADSVQDIYLPARICQEEADSAEDICLPAGIYQGDDSEILAIYENGLATYFCSDLAYQESNCPWRYEDGRITITLSKLHCDVFADIKNDNFDRFVLESDSSNWNAELFEKTDLTKYDRKLQCYDRALTVNENGEMIFEFLGMNFTVDKHWCDYRDEFDDIEDIILFVSPDADQNKMQSLLYCADSSGSNELNEDYIREFASGFMEELEVSDISEAVVQGEPAIECSVTGILKKAFGGFGGMKAYGNLKMVQAPENRGLIYILELGN